MDIYLNGKMMPPGEARLPVDDAGFQHAVGLFETFRVHHGKPFRLHRHLTRLCDSAVQLGLTRQMNPGPLAEAVEHVIAHNRLDEARVRLTVTPGSLSLLKPDDETAGGTSGGPTLLIVPTEPTVYDPAYFERGITVAIAPPGANPFDALAGHKTLAYWQRLRTLRQAAAAGEAIWLNVTNHLASGAISNVFLVKDGKLLTPIARGEEVKGALAAPVLPGVTRAAVMELIEAEMRMLSVEDMLDADEVFLTNSSWYVLPVTKVEKKAIGDGGVGPVTRDLRQRLLEVVDRETG